MDSTNQGFTLSELLIALTLIAILTAIAVPSYKIFVLKSHRVDAISTLTKDQAILERCYAQNFSYNLACAALPAFPQTSDQGYYSITLSNQTSATYTLTATATGNQTQDTTCRTFTLTQTNQKSAVNSGGAAQTTCWNP